MTPAERLLRQTVVDAWSLRLDCAPRRLAEQLADMSICGVRSAVDQDVAAGFAAEAIIPTDVVSLGSEHMDALVPFLAGDETPAGLCLEWGSLPVDADFLPEILREAAMPEFRPHNGSEFRLGCYAGRLVDVLAAPPNALTTTSFDPRITQYSVRPGGQWVGMHIDNAMSDLGNGERFRCADRLAKSDRRVLWNIGPGIRYLLVALNVTALHISDRTHPGDEDNIPDLSQLRSLLRQQPAVLDSILCLRLKLAVGDYVLFPAGMALHDGSTFDSVQPSRLVVLSGQFPRRTAPCSQREGC